MGGFIFSQLRFRPGRASALAAAIVVATASFSVLVAAGKTSEIRVRGSVRSNYRTAYDILVRPKGSALPLERDEGLVRDNYLSGLFGGITLAQYRQIERLPGVDVAAPIANIGYVIPVGNRLFSMNNLLTRDPVQLYRVISTTVAQAGTSRYPLYGNLYIYFTRRHRFAVAPGPGLLFGEVILGRAEPVKVCQQTFLNASGAPTTPFWQARDQGLACYSSRSPGYGSDVERPGVVQVGAGIFFPNPARSHRPLTGGASSAPRPHDRRRPLPT